jgi:hypothetical protein
MHPTAQEAKEWSCFRLPAPRSQAQVSKHKQRDHKDGPILEDRNADAQRQVDSVPTIK